MLIPSGSLVDAVVLVVDDQQTNVTLLERLLARAGVGRVVGITDPRRTIEHYQALGPDLILLDLHMPHLDGIAVLEALAAVIPAESYTPILVLTADTTLEAKQRALAAGAKDFVTKPFEQTEVLLRVKNLLETRSLHVSLKRHNAALQGEIRQNNERDRRLADEHQRLVGRVRRVLDHHDVATVYQPIVDLSTGHLVGVESLSRFRSPPHRGPDEWFAEAAAVGLGTELELLAVRAAIDQISQLPDDVYLAVNVSPRVAIEPQLAEILLPLGERIVLELTEHEQVDHYDHLLDTLDRFRSSGIRIAVDDAGSGYASLRHILRLHPDIIKLDIDLTRGVDLDPSRRALAAALVTFGNQIGAAITAEGVETADELDALRHLGVGYGQGYHLARPGPLPIPPATIAGWHRSCRLQATAAQAPSGPEVLSR
jgi:EAL domain-containing protein (putative c-di-GMP-specific phosphodiesterase class I)/CheY-like chemotaxis protein